MSILRDRGLLQFLRVARAGAPPFLETASSSDQHGARVATMTLDTQKQESAARLHSCETHARTVHEFYVR